MAALLLAMHWEKWTAIGTLAAAGATVLLAVVTVWLVRTTKGAVAGEAQQINLQRRVLEASQTPYVFPAPTVEWTDGIGAYAEGRWNEVLPVRNGGSGVALNVRGRLMWGPPSGTHIPLVRANLGPGDHQDMRINWAGGSKQLEWHGVSGFLDYEDATNRQWRTEFTIEIEGRRQIRVGNTRLRQPDDKD
jgi:hypothetical protein